MKLTQFAIRHKPVTLVFALIALIVGAQTFLTMSRRENPRITIRSCVIETRWLGADAKKVEDLVTEPIEDAVYQIEEVETIGSMSRTGFSRIDVELQDSVGPDEIDQVWDKVRDKVDVLRGSLPSGCSPPFVNSDFGDVSSICLVVYPTTESTDPETSLSYRELELIANDLETEIKAIPDVSSVTMFGVPDEVITLSIDADEWAKLGISAETLARAIDDRNLVNAGAVLSTEHRRYPLRPSGEIGTIDDLGRIPVATARDGRPVTIRQLPLQVSRGHESPRRNAVRFATTEVSAPRAVLLGIAMKEGKNVVQLGADVDEAVARFAERSLPAGAAIERVNDLPRQVDNLVSDFMESLWQAIVIVLAVAWLMMGWRPALVMAAAIPLSMVTTLAIVPQFGVELEQFAIASLIIVLGMVVDNAIVVTDNVQRLIDGGMAKERAAVEGTESLASSILSSTLTTVGAFLPMLLITGETGEYMRSLPIVVSSTLLTSYLVAMTVTPLMAATVLRPKPTEDAQQGWLTSAYPKLVKAAVTRRTVTLALAGSAIAASVGLVPIIGSQFFPGGIRDQFFIDVTLPAGSSLQATERVVGRIEQILRETSAQEKDGVATHRLASVTSFVGTGGPRLMLSLDPGDGLPHEAMLLVNTNSPEVSRPWVEELRSALATIPEARIDIRPYELGPPIDNPVEFRFTGDDLEVMRTAGQEMVDVLRGLPGTTGANFDWGELSYGLNLRVDSERAFLAGVSSASAASTLSDLYGGTLLTTLREGSHLVDVELRLAIEQRSDPASVGDAYVGSGDRAVPLGSLVSVEADWEHAAIGRRNRVRTLKIGARVLPGTLANDVAAEAKPMLDAIVDRLPPGYALEISGEAEETASSQQSVSGALKLSIVLIFLVLLTQYNSMTKPVVVLAAFPLSLIGALLGLFVTGWPLGFMPLLGIVALAGTVINNAIILIEFIENEVADGSDLLAAVASAGLARMQPILLTTLTTIGGLLPLALFGGPMWTGMSWAMIFGLGISTGLTLIVIPTVYVLFADRFGMRVSS